MDLPADLHIENLFSTPIVVDRPSDQAIGRAGLLAATSRLGGDAAALKAALDRAAVGSDGAALIAYVRRLADERTVDKRTGRPPQWDVGAEVLIAGASAQPEPPARYDAYWNAYYVLDDGYEMGATRDAGGELVFLAPRLPAPMAEMPDLRVLTARGAPPTFYAPELTIRPMSGQLFLVPSWLRVQQRARTGGRVRTLLRITLSASLDPRPPARA